MAKPGKHLLLDQLVADGTKYIFGNPGTTEQGFMDALQDYPQLKFILSLHEGVAVTMANAYARAARRPAFVELHTAPGLGNGIGMMVNAMRGRTPMVVYAGNADSRGMYTEPILGGDLVSLARPTVKWAVEAQSANDIPVLTRRALKVAAEPPEGPVFISVPMDVMEQMGDASAEPTTYTYWRARPEPAAAKRAAELLVNASAPVIQVGDGVAHSQAHAEVVALAELIGAPICGGGAELNIPYDEPLWSGGFDQAKFPNADLLLMIGANEASTLTGAPPPPLPRAMHVIQINTTSWELAKSYVVDIAIAADTRETAAELATLVRAMQTPDQAASARERRERAVQARKAELERLRKEDELRRDHVPIAPTRLIEEIGKVLPPDGALFNEGVTSAASIDRYVNLRPGHYFGGGGGGIGPGMPGPLGVQLALPESTVIGLEGDGSAMYTIQALWTAAHHNLPVTWVICNNGMYRILKVNVLNALGEAAAGRQFVEMDLKDPPLNFARIAESMGVRGRRVERPDELGDALREAVAHPGPALVDVVLDGSIPGRR